VIIQSIHVRNFRSILDETLECDELTVLVGANGSGKSSFLRALDLFYDPSPKVDVADYYDGNTAEAIVISITFKDLSEEAGDLFSS
jgi:predicted ATP-dependent endonuclease of OLD family